MGNTLEVDVVTKEAKMRKFILKIVILLSLVACKSGSTSPRPTVVLPSSVPELAKALSDPEEEVRYEAAQALADKGEGAAPAVPALIHALADSSQDVRECAAVALGEIGQAASSAVPTLVRVLESDSYIHARMSAALALGKIGPSAAASVPNLVRVLDDANPGLRGRAAYALAQITDSRWPDADGDGNGFYASDEGELLIVIAAREWWNREGKYQDWTAVSDE